MESRGEGRTIPAQALGVIDAETGYYRPTALSVRKYINGRMKEIKGPLGRDDALLIALINDIQRDMGVRGSLAEIGVGRGQTAMLLGLMPRTKERVHVIDLFDLPAKNDRWYNDPTELVENAKSLGILDRLNILRSDTTAGRAFILENLTEPKVRFAHIDGGTGYQAVLNDLLTMSDALSSGGVICCNRFFDRRQPGSTEAALDFLASRREAITPLLLSNSRLFMCTRSRKRAYLERLKSMIGNIARQGTMRESRILIFDKWKRN